MVSFRLTVGATGQSVQVAFLSGFPVRIPTANRGIRKVSKSQTVPEPPVVSGQSAARPKHIVFFRRQIGVEWLRKTKFLAAFSS